MYIEKIVSELSDVPLSVRDDINQSAQTEVAHRHYMQLACMNTIETGGASDNTPPLFPLRTMAWNLERCLDIKGSVEKLSGYSPSIILLSEMDNGMSRTGQKHTTRVLAESLGMYYAYGVEFLELDLGNDADQKYAVDSINEKGFHGNAILSKMPFVKLAMLRFDSHGHWFSGLPVGNSFGQRRVGGRMALLGVVKVEGIELCVVSTHLESNADTTYRQEQFQCLLDAIGYFVGSSMPVVIGGDLNTGNNLAKGLDHRAETLFASAQAQGFHWRANPEGMTTRPSLLTKRPERTMKLDWFCARHLDSAFEQIVPSLDNNGVPLSDHDAIVADWLNPSLAG